MPVADPEHQQAQRERYGAEIDFRLARGLRSGDPRRSAPCPTPAGCEPPKAARSLRRGCPGTPAGRCSHCAVCSGAHRVELQAVALRQFGDARIRQQLTHALDVQIDFERQRHALHQAAPHRIADRQVEACIQMIDPVFQFEIRRADLEAAGQILRRAAAPARLKRRECRATRRTGVEIGSRGFERAEFMCLVKAA